ncbi:hypothetical protein M2480_003191 [Parabacteroides sp. PFB2-12]|uniref:hypothetical protein n=1 Tax=unclassified Parabacteroides TaxID=2649774 RepID=UPI0024760FE4|nr:MULTISPECIES: hypothetical protein [unclassified Parabacteroides]MDH6344298.1 hypothetical protein [Parabacteroides sp. PM6-13]MDH6392183.1 hypothetical protein [Parabacteroides sp. PFB2-12]MDL2309598.1 hypothetical protein [Parabacteroides sp. OttesenSCG-928-B22]
MKVFISGSISIKRLRENDIPFLEEIIEGNRTILIGDAFGLDKAVQEYLCKNEYQDVVVYYSGENIRNNVGGWPTRQIPNPENLTGRLLYKLKDKAMGDDCDSALMFWDGKSKGTEQNMTYLDELDKYYLVITEDSLSVCNMHNINNMIML